MKSFWLTMLACVALFTAAAFATDTDSDGVDDDVDNCVDVANDHQGDTDFDGYGNACDADFDDDGTVAGTDFGIYQTQYGTPGETDHNCDGDTGGADFALFKNLYGNPPGDSGHSCAGDPPCPRDSDDYTAPAQKEAWPCPPTYYAYSVHLDPFTPIAVPESGSLQKIMILENFLTSQWAPEYNDICDGDGDPVACCDDEGEGSCFDTAAGTDICGIHMSFTAPNENDGGYDYVDTDWSTSGGGSMCQSQSSGLSNWDDDLETIRTSCSDTVTSDGGVDTVEIDVVSRELGSPPTREPIDMAGLSYRFMVGARMDSVSTTTVGLHELAAPSVYVERCTPVEEGYIYTSNKPEHNFWRSGVKWKAVEE